MTRRASKWSRTPYWILLFTGQELFEGKTFTFPQKESKAAVVMFLSATCPCSASHEKALRDLSEKYSKEGFEFIAVHSNQNETQELAKLHFKSAGLPFPIVEDRGAKIADELKALKTPHVFVIQNNQIVYQGGVDDSNVASEAKTHYLADALQELKENKPITVAKSRSLGCQIKR